MRGKCVPLFVDREGMGKMVRTALRTFTEYGQKPLTAITRYATGSITHVTTQHPIAALTFDDGPHPKYTPQLLEILAKYRAHATFFMLGENARKYPELVKRVSAEGHVVANHSWDHPSFPLISAQQRREQIRACNSAIEPYGGVRLFRPPYGHQSLSSRLDALYLGYPVIMWNVDAEDWVAHDARWMADVLIDRIARGSVILLHDAIQRSMQNVPQYNREQMVEAVDITLNRLSGRLQFVTIPTLLRCGTPQYSNWNQKPSPDMKVRLNDHPAIGQRHAASGAPVWSDSNTRI